MTAADYRTLGALCYAAQILLWCGFMSVMNGCGAAWGWLAAVLYVFFMAHLLGEML